MKETLKNKISSLHKEYVDLETIIKEKRDNLEEKRLKIKSDTDTDLQEKVDFFKEATVDLVLFTTDQKIRFDKLFFLINLYKESGFDGLTEDIVEFYKKFKPYSPVELFIVKDGNLIEKEEGSLEKARESFMNNNNFMKELLVGKN